MSKCRDNLFSIIGEAKYNNSLSIVLSLKIPDNLIIFILDGDLYAATVSDFSGTDSLIIKNLLRTEQYDYKHLNGKLFLKAKLFYN